MRYERTPAFHTRRDAWVEIDLGGFEYNVNKIKKALPDGVALMAVIKADAYGIGYEYIAELLKQNNINYVLKNVLFNDTN